MKIIAQKKQQNICETDGHTYKLQYDIAMYTLKAFSSLIFLIF